MISRLFLEMFQFHTGSIKSASKMMPRSKRFKFQFHTGSIKSLPPACHSKLWGNRFNSILVRLKAACV